MHKSSQGRGKPPRLAPPLFSLSSSKIPGHRLRARQGCARSASQAAQPGQDLTGALAASLGRTAPRRETSDFDGSKSAAGTLCGCQGALTPQCRKNARFPALFSCVIPAFGTGALLRPCALRRGRFALAMPAWGRAVFDAAAQGAVFFTPPRQKTGVLCANSGAPMARQG